MKEQEHPSIFIDPAVQQVISGVAAEAERLGELHPEQLAIIYQENWFNLYVPAEYGGLERGLPVGLHTQESLAYADGSTGWTVTLCSGANWFAGFLQPPAAAEIFEDPRVCLAGSGKASGIARVVAQGYEITGYWQYATGAPHATVFTANCLVEKDGLLLRNENDEPLVQSFWFWKKEVLLHHDWNCTGMVATASISFEVKQLAVPAERCFVISSDCAFTQQLIYRYPFLQFAEATLAVNSAGMGYRFLDLCEPLIREKYSGKYQFLQQDLMALLQEARQQLQGTRNRFYDAIEESWQVLEQQGQVPQLLLEKISASSRAMAAVARAVTDELYPYCGLAAANTSTEINRVWRNLHTASQHNLLLLPQQPGNSA